MKEVEKGQWQMGCWSSCRSEVKGERGKTRPARGGSNPGTEEKSSEVHKLQSRVSVEISFWSVEMAVVLSV